MTTQLIWLFTLAIPIACIAWTVTHEEVFVEIREYCINCSKTRKHLLVRKFFYLFTCEYCFSHWVTLVVLIVTGFKLLFDDWRGYVLAFFLLPWVANQWMSLYRLLRVDIKHENALAEMSINDVKEER